MSTLEPDYTRKFQQKSRGTSQGPLASSSWAEPQFLVGIIDSPAFLAAQGRHVTEFKPMTYEQKCCVQLLESVFGGKGLALLLLFPDV